MASTKDGSLPDERIGGPPRQRSRADLLVEEILELQKKIRSLERELQRTQKAESLVALPKEVPSDYPG